MSIFFIRHLVDVRIQCGCDGSSSSGGPPRGTARVAVGFFWLWWVQRRTEDASLVDVAWACDPRSALAVFYAWIAGAALEPDARGLARISQSPRARGRRGSRGTSTHVIEVGPRTVAIARFASPAATRAQAFFFVFFQLQGLLALLLSLPFLVIAFNAVAPARTGSRSRGASRSRSRESRESRSPIGSSPATRAIRRTEGQDVPLRPVALLAPSQLLLRVARLVRLRGLAALAAPYGALGLVSPVVMLVLILFVTGIPPTEARSLRSKRGDEYRAYQASTSAFLPWFPAKEKTSLSWNVAFRLLETGPSPRLDRPGGVFDAC